SELIPNAEAKYRIDPAPRNRLLGGVSAGGYGALNLMLKHPAQFSAVALFSPAVYDPLPPSHSSAMRMPFFQSAGAFDPERWRQLNYPAQLEAYKRSGSFVPVFICSGDRDNLGIALASAQLSEQLRVHQPGAIALRIAKGDHDWEFWRGALPGALLFLDEHLRRSTGSISPAGREQRTH
ncbi:MAG: alpha/beta hydrolase-fold protein, partial [Usitatibacteraceae bacterium]